MTACFEADGNLSGSSGCDTYSAGFAAYDQTLQIGRLAATQAICSAPAGVMDQENIFVASMQQRSNE